MPTKMFIVDKIAWNAEGDSAELEKAINARSDQGYMLFRLYAVNYGDKVDVVLITVQSAQQMVVPGGVGT